MSCDGAEDVIVTVNSTKNLSSTSNAPNSFAFLGETLCAKVSMLLQVSYEIALCVYVCVVNKFLVLKLSCFIFWEKVHLGP